HDQGVHAEMKTARRRRSRRGKAATRGGKRVHSFGGGVAEGGKDMKALLGGKGANLAEMATLGLPVPPGFTITTEVCEEYWSSGRKLPAALWDEVGKHMARVEEALDATFGKGPSPVLVSVRSGAAISMPGMMETVLNVGLNDETREALAAKTGNP